MSIVLLKRNEPLNLGYLKIISTLVLLRVKGCYTQHTLLLLSRGVLKLLVNFKKTGGFVLDTEISPLPGQSSC